MKLLASSIITLGQIAKQCQSSLLLQTRNYAARKGTRERKKKAMKPKEEVVKETFQTKKARLKEEQMKSRPSLIFDDSYKPLPQDNVYRMRYYRWPLHSFEQAIQLHRETHHPEIFNSPNSNVDVTIELNMDALKKNKYIDNFYRTAAIPHWFEHGEERRILGFTKEAKQQEEAKEAGILMVGGPELVKEVQNGNISLHDFDFVIAHPAVLPELVALRGLLKKKFPNPKLGTLDPDFLQMTNRFLHGISYSAVKDSYQKEFGLINAVIGKLDMEMNFLEENFKALMDDILSNKPSGKKGFVRRIILSSAPSLEKLMIDHEKYTGQNTTQNTEEEEDDEEAEPIEARG